MAGIDKLIEKETASLIKLATKHFNTYIRLRDSRDGFFQCISCRKIKSIDQMNAGHFYPTTKSATRFDEDNVHGQCIRCNHYLSGNLALYRENLSDKIGLEKLNILDAKAWISQRWDKLELAAIIVEYRQKVKKLKGGR